MADEAKTIDDYLSKKGSPMTGLGNVFVAAGKKYGVDPRLMVAISGAESSFGKHTYGAHNAWGWGPGIHFGSYPEAISTIAKGLRSGYLNQGLKTPGQISSKWAPVGASNDPGGLNQNWTSNVEGFMKDLGGAPGSTTRVAATASLPPASSSLPAPPSFDSLIIGNAGKSPEYQVRSLVDAMLAQESRPSAPARLTRSAGTAVSTPVPRSGGGTPGRALLSAHADRPGVPIRPQVIDAVKRISGVYGAPLTIGTGTNHNQFVAGTNRQSAHWTGWAADVPMAGEALTHLGRAALIANGMPRAKANRQTGGLFNMPNGVQIIFNSMIGGNHFNHLHVGLGHHP